MTKRPPKSRRPKTLRRVKAAYHKPEAGEWVQPVPRGYKMACCDCGLVHLMNFRVLEGRVQFAVFRAKRSTAAIRRSPHDFLPVAQLDEVAAAFLKATRKRSVRVGEYRYRLKAPK